MAFQIGPWRFIPRTSRISRVSMGPLAARRIRRRWAGVGEAISEALNLTNLGARGFIFIFLSFPAGRRSGADVQRSSRLRFCVSDARKFIKLRRQSITGNQSCNRIMTPRFMVLPCDVQGLNLLLKRASIDWNVCITEEDGGGKVGRLRVLYWRGITKSTERHKPPGPNRC